MKENENTVKILTLEKEHEAILPLLKKAFEDADIAMHFHSKLDSAYDGIFVTQKGLGDIFVFEKDRERAAEILTDILPDYEAGNS
jgi:hypothetical protein